MRLVSVQIDRHSSDGDVCHHQGVGHHLPTRRAQEAVTQPIQKNIHASHFRLGDAGIASLMSGLAQHRALTQPLILRFHGHLDKQPVQANGWLDQRVTCAPTQRHKSRRCHADAATA